MDITEFEEMATKSTKFGTPKDCLYFNWADDNINQTCDIDYIDKNIHHKCKLLDGLDCKCKRLL